MFDLSEIERDASLDQLVVANESGQIAWKQVMAERFEQFDYEHDFALKWHVLGRQKSVLIDPRVSFGAPTVMGIPTWAIKGRWDAGETLPEITADFGINERAVVEGLQFEGVPMAA